MNTKYLGAAAAAVIALSAGSAMAQNTAANSADTAASYPDAAVAPVVEEDDGMDLGWLGLLGLAGLLGLRKRHVETVRTHPSDTGPLHR